MDASVNPEIAYRTGVEVRTLICSFDICGKIAKTLFFE